MWIVYVIVYAMIIGVFTVFRKKAVQQSNILFVLAFASTIGFLLIGWNFSEPIQLDTKNILLILLKSFLISLSWSFELTAIKGYYISVLQPISAIRVVIGFFTSMLIFNEATFWWQYIGVFVVGFGIFILNKDSNKDKSSPLTKKQKNKCIALYVISCICSEASAIIDKFTLQSITPIQMQWWYMLFVAAILWIYFLIQCLAKKKMLVSKKDFDNVYLYLFAVLLIIADQLLFKGLNDPASKASIVAILKQISTIVSVILGAYMFKEPNLKKKLVYLGIIMCGIIIILI